MNSGVHCCMPSVSAVVSIFINW